MRTGNKCSQAGLTFIEFLVVVMVLVVLAAAVVPDIARRNRQARWGSCSNNLKQISLAMKQWALDNNDKFPMQVSVTNGGTMEWTEAGNVWMSFLVMSNELNTPRVLFCPQEENRQREMAVNFLLVSPPAGPTVFSTNNVSYFIGVDADETRPNDFLIGDDNFTVNRKQPVPGLLHLWTNSPVAWTKQRHVNKGNIGLADGSVFCVSSSKLQEFLTQTGSATNRLAMP